MSRSVLIILIIKVGQLNHDNGFSSRKMWNESSL